MIGTAAEIDAVRAWQEQLYRELHQHPELSHQEHRTAGLVADRLRRAGFEVSTGCLLGAAHLLGGTDRAAFRTAEADGRVASAIPSNHSPHFAPVIRPTLDTGTAALVTAALAWLGR